MLPKKKGSLELNNSEQRAEINPLMSGVHSKLKQKLQDCLNILTF